MHNNPPPTLPPPPKNPKGPSHQHRQEKRQERQLELAVRAIRARREAEQTLGFVAPELAHVGLPLRRSKGLAYTRRDHHLTLRLVGDPAYGLPFGQDRLVIFFLCTAFQAADCPADNRIFLRFCKDLLELFGIPVNGNEMKLLKERILRVCNTTFTVEEDDKAQGRLYVRYTRLVEEFYLTSLHDQPRNQHLGWGNYFELTPRFAKWARAHSMPFDFETIIALKEHPAAQDLYLLESRRSYQLWRMGQEETRIPVMGRGGLREQLASTIKDEWRFRAYLARWHQLVLSKWVECKNELSSDGKCLIVRPGQAVAGNAKLALREVVCGTEEWKQRRPKGAKPLPFEKSPEEAAAEEMAWIYRKYNDAPDEELVPSDS
jgi:hypothetical protein